MARVTVEDCLEMVENRFALVHLATKRARQLTAGARSLIDAPGNKEVVTSLREIAAGVVKSQVPVDLGD
jgi:DNA-directed RNA polymerase subunit omega